MIAHCSELRHRPKQRWCVLAYAFALLWSAASAYAAPRIAVWGAPTAVLPGLQIAQPAIDWQLEAAATDAQLHIAWHAEAYERALQQEQRAPMLLISSSLSRRPLKRPQDAALLWGPPLAQQVRLARRVMPLAKRIGVMIRKLPDQDMMLTLEREIDLLAIAMKAEGVTVVPLLMKAPMTARAIAEAAEQVDIFVASNDEVLFNRDSAKLILLTAYRHQRALIGPSPAFVSAGAVATMAVPKSALLAALLARVERWQKTGHIGESASVEAFKPVLNPQVARSLGLFLAPDLLREAKP